MRTTSDAIRELRTRKASETMQRDISDVATRTHDRCTSQLVVPLIHNRHRRVRSNGCRVGVQRRNAASSLTSNKRVAQTTDTKTGTDLITPPEVIWGSFENNPASESRQLSSLPHTHDIANWDDDEDRTPL